MTQRSETFGRLLKGAINSIAAYEGKSAMMIEDELGTQIGVTGGSIQRYKAGYLPPEPRPVQILAEAGVRRGFLARAWLTRFLQAARYPTPEALIASLADALGAPAPAASGGFPTGTLALLFTDIVGSTEQWEQQPRLMERALERHDVILRQAIDSYGGKIFKTVGEAYYSVFTTTPAALEAALAAQRALQAEAWGDRGLHVRMAIHVGALQPRDGDYFGPPLNRGVRILSAAHGVQVLLSLSAQELVRDLLPPGVSLRDLGEHHLKDLSRPERIFQAVVADLPAEFPPLRSLDSYRHNLPLQATPLIGREDQVTAVAALLRRSNTRLVTLTGPGGIGKTRLALQSAVEQLDHFADGVVFVPLAPLSQPDLVLTAIAQLLGVVETAEQPLAERVQNFLQRRQLLLVLDNFEHVIAAAPLVAELLAAAPALTVLVTSREALRLYGEQEYAVPPLLLPDMLHLPPMDRLTQYEAVRLFIERAQAVRPEFAVSVATAPVIAEICARLDGLPLAIELAAARVKVFPPQALLTRLDRRLHLLTGGPRDLPARQQTLAGAIAWSYDLLDVTEQALFARLGVFAGGCDIEAAEAVLGDNGTEPSQAAAFIPADSVIAGLTSLVDKSLLQQAPGGGGEPRFWMLETVREFALERLAQSGEEQVVRRRHAQHFAALLHRPHTTDSTGWHLRLDQELDNIREALSWAITSDEAAPALAICAEFFFWENHPTEGRRWIAAALALPSAAALPEARFYAHYSAGTLARDQRDLAAARAAFTVCLTIGEELGGPNRFPRWSLAWCDLSEGHVARAMSVFEELLEAFTADTASAEGMNATGSATTRGWLRFGVAAAAVMLGDSARAAALYEAAGEDFSLAHHKVARIYTLAKLGYVFVEMDKCEQALAVLHEALKQARASGTARGVALCIGGIAGALLRSGDSARAARLYGAMTALKALLGVAIDPDDQQLDAQRMERTRAQLGDEAYVTAFRAGQLLTGEQLFAEVFT